jgi:hypothetical protein
MILITNDVDRVVRKTSYSKEIIKLAEKRMRLGFAPPPEIYRIENRRRIDWFRYPAWARPVDPEVFEGCCHEGSSL